MEELKKQHHNHKLTDLLKFAIFSIVMLAPFLSIGVRCGYIMWNKNAKDSYSDNTMFENNVQITSPNQIHEGITYYYQYYDNNYNNQFTKWLGFTQLSFNPVDYGFTDTEYNKIQTYNNRIYLYNIGGTYEAKEIWGTRLQSFSIVSNGQYSTSSDTMANSNTKIFEQTFLPNKLDNAFSYSVSQISNDPIFNWTRNTGIYTPINAMCTGLELEHDTIQILLAYWALMTAIYIVFDLIIFCFTKLTHFING